MASKLLNLYKICQDFYANTKNNEGIEIGLPTKEFREVIEEAYALGPYFYNFDHSNIHTIKEIKFNTPGGVLEIYEKIKKD